MESKLSKKSEYLLVECTGSYNRPDTEAMFSQALEVAAKENQQNVLFDFRQLSDLIPIFDKYFVTEGVAKLCAGYLPKIQFQLAVVGNERLITKDRFAETVFRNRGGSGIVTTDFNEALAWFKAQGDQG